MAQQKNQGNQGTEEKGSMTVEEAGRMGGQRVRELVEEGKQAEGEQGGGGESSGGSQQQQGGRGSQNR
ncbi:hypothetical protein [Polyangium jinanense]|uniref:Uncharacterized protein n=1 Tax=Polyangium jinanense TaxID=2829994 RepID=A0A9X4AU39_9BACT|nr:hypothetical protein [Polyangium jinanense]MDC3959410.1 hypothetical protein [Polyangium jinanense]MDC3984844.1 hypothetical protein [Polyangium jinanense]